MSLKKSIVIGMVVLAVFALVVGIMGKTSVEAADGLQGTAYVAGHGGHLAIINLATLQPPTDIEKDRIVITEAGSEMEGKIAGMDFAAVKKAGGSHGSTIIGKTLYVGLLNGNVVTYDITTGKKSAPMQVGKKFCDAVAGPDGNIYFEDMADGHVYVFDPKGLKTVDSMPVGAAVCGIGWTKNVDKAYVSDMPQGKVFVIDWKTKKTIKEITDPDMTFLHQLSMTNDGKQVWVTAANEFDPGLKPGTHHPYLIVIDTKTDKIVDRIQLPDTIRTHDVKFSPDGKTALITGRDYVNKDGVLALMDVKTHKIEKTVSLCTSCHKPNGVQVTIDDGAPLLCGLAIDWKK
jgi:DNA-binding beta-propeller fold protein YncE